MNASAPASPVADGALAAALGPTLAVWRALVAVVTEAFPAVSEEWKPSKVAFGRICLLKQGLRTLVYLIPGRGGFEVSVVLGERAAALALASEALPAEIKRRVAGARSYAEGRGVRFPVTRDDEVPAVVTLVTLKLAPK
jgi:hypothetical protein